LGEVDLGIKKKIKSLIFFCDKRRGLSCFEIFYLCNFVVFQKISGLVFGPTTKRKSLFKFYVRFLSFEKFLRALCLDDKNIQ